MSDAGAPLSIGQLRHAKFSLDNPLTTYGASRSSQESRTRSADKAPKGSPQEPQRAAPVQSNDE